MFTGIVEEVGVVRAVRPLGHGVELDIQAETVLAGLALGDSIAIDGVCQTVVAAGADHFTVQAIATTLERTTFGGFDSGRRVNLERALALGQRLGGHMVQGHVDAVGSVTAIEPRGELVLIDVVVPPEIAAVTILHGSITINGISLTVNSLPAPGVVQVSIIPYTWGHTNLSDLAVGDGVNLEGDLIGKYVRQLLGAPAGGHGGHGDVLRAWGYERSAE
jgi:riboflavin synthase